MKNNLDLKARETAMAHQTSGNIRAVLFDFMGTCLDWHASIVKVLPQSLSETLRSQFAVEWRQTYFDANAIRASKNLPPLDIDIMHRETLDVMLERYPNVATAFAEDTSLSARAIAAWHEQPAWPDVAPELQKLRHKGLEVFVHANGTTRLQLDLVRSSGLQGLFDMLFSSELLGHIKPAPEAYGRFLELARLRPEECVMVAAHAYDTRGAKQSGMKTVYVFRHTDDVKEDQSIVRSEHDAYLDNGMSGLSEVLDAWL